MQWFFEYHVDKSGFWMSVSGWGMLGFQIVCLVAWLLLQSSIQAASNYLKSRCYDLLATLAFPLAFQGKKT